MLKLELDLKGKLEPQTAFIAINCSQNSNGETDASMYRSYIFYPPRSHGVEEKLRTSLDVRQLDEARYKED